MLASQTSITFPAIAFFQDDAFFTILKMDELTTGFSKEGGWLIGAEIVDTRGQTFRVKDAIDPRRQKPKSWLSAIFSQPTYCFDLELEALPPAPFEETRRRILEREGEDEALWIQQGGGPDAGDRKAGIQRSQSLEDLIAQLEAVEERPPKSTAKR